MGTNTPKPNNRPSHTAANQKLLDGITQHQSALGTLLIAGTSFTPAQMISKLQEIITTANAVATSRAAFQAAVKADRSERSNTASFVSGVRQAILVAFQGQLQILADFGLTDRKHTPLTPAQKQEAAAKAKATRAARHTMGKKQKAGITGASQPSGTASPAPVVASPQAATPVLAPAAPAAPAVVSPVHGAAPAAAPAAPSNGTPQS